MLKYARFTENPRVQFLAKFRPVRLGSLHSHQRYTAWAVKVICVAEPKLFGWDPDPRTKSLDPDDPNYLDL